MIQIFGNGARLLLDYLRALACGESTTELWAALWADPSFMAWIEAYAPWIEHLEEHIQVFLREPMVAPKAEPVAFWQAIAQGIAQAMEKEGNSRCRRTLDALLTADLRGAEAPVLAYLPPDTPLDIEVHLTVDGFNTGMFRGRRAFLSVFKIVPERGRSILKGLGHEFHHIGANYWFERNTQLQKARERDAGSLLAVEVITYLVGEGMANAFFSPQVLEPAAGISSEAQAHNERLRELEARWPAEAIEGIEQVLLGALAAPSAEEVDDLEAAFQAFSVDLSEAGLPEGHFVAGRMVQRMARSLPRERIVGLVQAPWDLIGLYNTAVGPREPGFSPALLEALEQAFGSA